MLKGYISEKTNDAINKIIESLFNGNALFDNISYNLDVVFNMPLASDIVHHKIAHWLPAPYADDIQTFQSQRNVKPIRPNVQGQSKVYNNYLECFEESLNYFLNLENDFRNAIKISDQELDIESRIFLENKYMELLPYTKQMNIWNKKAIDYNDNIGSQSFDIDFEKFTFI